MPERRYFFGPFCFDGGTRELLRDGAEVDLTPKAAAVLQYLLDNAGQLAPKTELMGAVWPHTHVGHAVLKVAVRDIRRALGDDATRPTYIATVHRRGYRFMAEVQVATDTPGAASKPPPSGHDGRSRGASAAAAAPSAAPVAQWPSSGRAVPLLGREAPLAQLEALLTRARGGESSVVCLRGAAGAGKTALVAAFARRLDGRAYVLCVECAGLGGPTPPTPLHPLVTALAAAAEARGPSFLELARIRAPTWLVRFATVAPEAREALVGARALGAGAHRLAGELEALVRALAWAEPLVVVLEDLDRADALTREVLERFVACVGAPTASREQLLVLLTYRPEGSLDRVSRELLESSGGHLLGLAPLDRAMVGALLTHGDAGGGRSKQALDWAWAASGGHPGTVAEIGALWEAEARGQARVETPGCAVADQGGPPLGLEARLEMAIDAAEEARARGDFAEAVCLLDEAEQLIEGFGLGERGSRRLPVALSRATARLELGQCRVAEVELAEVVSHARALGHPGIEAEACIALSSCTPEVASAEAHLRRAAMLASQVGQPELAEDAEGRLAYIALCTTFGAVEARSHALGAGLAVEPSLPGGARPLQAAHARARARRTARLALLPAALCFGGELDRAVALVESARAELIAHGELHAYLWLIAHGMEPLLHAGKLERAFELLAEAEGVAKASAAPRATPLLAFTRASASLAVGDRARVLSIAADLGGVDGSARGLSLVGIDALAAEAVRRAGRPAEAVQLLASHAIPATDHAAGHATDHAGNATDHAALPADALDRIPGVVGPPGPFICLEAELTLSRAEVSLGQRPRARRRIERLVRACRSLGQRHTLARALATAARIARLEGRLADAEATLAEATGLAPDAQLPFAAVEVHLERLAFSEAVGQGGHADAARTRLAAIAESLADELAERPRELSAFRGLPWVRLTHALPHDRHDPYDPHDPHDDPHDGPYGITATDA